MINLTDYGFMPDTMPKDIKSLPARVTAAHRDRYEIVCKYGQIYAKLKTSVYYNNSGENFPTTGDFVLFNHIPESDSVIVKTLERKSLFSRLEPGPIPRQQAIAANFDYVFIMASLNHDFNIRRIERYLAIANQSGGVPVVVLTKADLAGDFSARLRETEDIAAGAAVHAVSAVTGFGTETLAQYFKPGKTIVFLGSSGVGKSSLVNALAGEDIMAVNAMRNVDASKGRHTTTHRQLVMLSGGVMVIDTPGMRELAMIDISENLAGSFADVEQFLGKCKFNDCGHQSEPGCAVKAAIENGRLSPKRWESYQNLDNEAKHGVQRQNSKKGKKIKERGGIYDEE
ncbi:MAG: ribosome small subunit-dependent GTPase A [Oscillospiraceae bacterium]|nr:ribosome small subunit-dependent GTPase A [Oscillospiraceae bacterium]